MEIGTTAKLIMVKKAIELHQRQLQQSRDYLTKVWESLGAKIPYRLEPVFDDKMLDGAIYFLGEALKELDDPLTKDDNSVTSGPPSPGDFR